MNLAVWFALHVMFPAVHSVGQFGIDVDLPVPGSIDWQAAALSLAAMVAMLRFKVGILLTLGACAAVGLLLR